MSDIQKYTPISVKITFLRMDSIDHTALQYLPTGYVIEKIPFVEVSLYRYLYNTVGYKHCWWMRRVMSDQILETILNNPFIEVYLLKNHDGVICGFYELDLHNPYDVNIAYFGLMPDYIGKGLGRAFLSQAVINAWEKSPQCIRVNTCNLDHKRALDLYKKVGFEPFKIEIEHWNVPDQFRFPIPKRFLQKK